MTVGWVRLSTLRRFCNPINPHIENQPLGNIISEHMINIVKYGHEELPPEWKDSAGHIYEILDRVFNGWKKPIIINVGDPKIDFFPHPNNFVVDGIYELAAAIYCGDEDILADVYGCEETARRLGLWPDINRTQTRNTYDLPSDVSRFLDLWICKSIDTKTTYKYPKDTGMDTKVTLERRGITIRINPKKFKLTDYGVELTKILGVKI